MAKRKAPTEPLPALDSADEVPVPLPRMIHALHTVAGVSVVDAIGIVRVLAQKKRHTPSRLRRLSAPELEELGAPCAGPTRDRVVEALREVASSGVMRVRRSDRLSSSDYERMCACVATGAIRARAVKTSRAHLMWC